MYLLYSFVLVTWGLLLIPLALYRAWRHHKHFPGLSQRFGNLPATLKNDSRPTFWFHACSVGETLSLQPLVETLHKRFPRARFVFSTVTQTGQAMAVQQFKAYGPGNTFYFPVDLAFVVKRVLDWIQPAIIIIIDTEIWPNLAHEAYMRRIPVVLANGRISGSSFPYYKLARPILTRVLRQYCALMMQSDEDADRIKAMGAPLGKVVVTGNMKFDKSLVENTSSKKEPGGLETTFIGQCLDSPLIVAGSTHPGEEQILLDALRRVRKLPELSQTRLLLAPRHPERFAEVAGLIKDNKFSLRKRTDTAASDGTAEVLLLDTLGELAGAYCFATVAFVGGTLIRRGGHSILEPAFYSKAIVTGPSMENFRGVVEEFRRHNAIRQISAGPENRVAQLEQLAGVFMELLRNAPLREFLGKNAFTILEKNRGATRITAEHIASLFNDTDSRAMSNPESADSVSFS